MTLSRTARESNYRHQTGRQTVHWVIRGGQGTTIRRISDGLTPAQRRRANKKAMVALRRGRYDLAEIPLGTEGATGTVRERDL